MGISSPLGGFWRAAEVRRVDDSKAMPVFVLSGRGSDRQKCGRKPVTEVTQTVCQYLSLFLLDEHDL